jgi:SAM-dependent methyltransferase
MPEKISDCRVCGNMTGSHFQAGDDLYFRCARCRTVQKVLTPEEYRALDPGYDPGLFLIGASEDDLRAFLAVDNKRRVIEELVQQIGRGAAGLSLLDVGCGMGGYLLAGRDLGMTVEGFEPSETHSTIARDALDLSVTVDYFSADKVEGRRFDIVILSHVIEHIYKPANFLAELVSVLKPGGILLVVTPNADAVIARLVGRAWPMLVPIDHVTMLTPKAIGYLAPAGTRARVTTTEYAHEFAATIGSVIKSKLRGRPVNTPDRPTAVSAKLLNRSDWRSRAVRQALAMMSFPFHRYALRAGRGACLKVTLIRDPLSAFHNARSGDGAAAEVASASL